MKKHGQPQPQSTSQTRVIWEQNDKFLSQDEQNSIKQKILQNSKTPRMIVVAEASATNYHTVQHDNPTFEQQPNNVLEYRPISVEAQLSQFNHFDLPFGCQQPTAVHAHLLGVLIKTAFLPETPLDTVVSFVRHLYHQYSANVQPQLFRLSEAHHLPFYERWLKDYTWLEEFDRESWWDISKRLSDEGCFEDALLAHYQAMPTNNEFQKILKDLCNFENTSDGRWLAASTSAAAQKVDRPGLGVYGAQVNLKTTKITMSDRTWLQLNSQSSVVNKTKSVERFICTLLMVYRATSSFDVLKHLQTLPQNLYIGNPDFDLVDPSRMNEVIKHHEHNNDVSTTVVWDGIDIPLSSPDIQDLWATLSMGTLGHKSAVVWGDSTDKHTKLKLQWYDVADVYGSQNHWVCFASTQDMKFTNPQILGKETIQSIEELMKILK